jgi:small conductance mechanosensitive channel
MQYDLTVKKVSDLAELKKLIVNAVRKLPGLLREPAPEVLVVDANPDFIKMRVLWSTHDPRQHRMLASYDEVLTAIVEALDNVGKESRHRSVA